MLNKQYYVEKAKVEKLIARKNQKTDFYNGGLTEKHKTLALKLMNN